MKWLAAGLTFVNAATLAALLLGMIASGLSRGIVIVSFIAALIAAVFAWWGTADDRPRTGDQSADQTDSPWQRYRRVGLWILGGVFGFFAMRSFCWLVFSDGASLKVQSPNNLGDLALHFAYINNFASGVPLWPDNPIFPFSYMRYPAGTDLFNALLVLLGIDIKTGLIWAGLVASVASFYALYRWGGSFAIAGFLFNGGLAGFTILMSRQWIDYQGANTIAWKSLPLSMFVTQRGILYALPAGLLLLYHWRAKYFPDRNSDGDTVRATPGHAILPLWLELILYASMPLFHMHTFIALSIVAAFFFLFGNSATRRQLLTVVGAAFLPATFFVWTITDRFRARSLLEWKPGWVRGTGEFQHGFFEFWLLNFGITIPLALLLIGVLCYRAWRSLPRDDKPPPLPEQTGDDETVVSFAEMKRFVSPVFTILRTSAPLGFVLPATFLFLFACLVKTAPWEWDNIKLIIWAYIIVLPFLWSELIARWPVPIRVGVCVALFTSGFVSLFGGLATGREGFGLIDRAEFNAVGTAVRKLPTEHRIATFPTYNHPVLMQGRKVVLGYPGHLWTQGFNYADVEKRLSLLMRGAPDWREQAQHLGVRYLFWGREEKTAYRGGTRPWEEEAPPIAAGPWGAIYDLEAAPLIRADPGQ